MSLSRRVAKAHPTPTPPAQFITLPAAASASAVGDGRKASAGEGGEGEIRGGERAEGRGPRRGAFPEGRGSSREEAKRGLTSAHQGRQGNPCASRRGAGVCACGAWVRAAPPLATPPFFVPRPPALLCCPARLAVRSRGVAFPPRPFAPSGLWQYSAGEREVERGHGVGL